MTGTRLGGRHHDTSWQVGDAHPGLAGVAMLAAGAGATEIVYADLLFSPLHTFTWATRDEPTSVAKISPYPAFRVLFMATSCLFVLENIRIVTHCQNRRTP